VLTGDAVVAANQKAMQNATKIKVETKSKDIGILKHKGSRFLHVLHSFQQFAPNSWQM
jgi:hypothetical protein